ncbi:MAG: NifU family protein [Thermoflexibacter sp.]|jgi:Fe-S cluster biogenesis protein NfuA|nr:NifU family protein [Thermoflexibacter sp.]
MYDRKHLYKRQVNIYTERVPNPNSMKFVMNFMLAKDESLIRDYADVSATADSPLAETLFGFDYVKRVFITKNFITITKKEDTEWEEILSSLKSFIKNYIEEGGEVLLGQDEDDNEPAKIGTDTDTETIKQIKDILEEYIRPAVEGDGGAIMFHSFDESTGSVKVLLQGSCSGCPSSTITLKAGIENLLKRMVPDVKEVIAEGV